MRADDVRLYACTLYARNVCAVTRASIYTVYGEKALCLRIPLRFHSIK